MWALLYEPIKEDVITAPESWETCLICLVIAFNFIDYGRNFSLLSVSS